MTDLIERISFIVPVISICFVSVITSINLYRKIRQNFPIRVNCWFCNANTSVPYNQFNSWTCGHCDQYNGFDKDGDYNCDIPAQRSIQLNKRWKTGVNADNFSYAATTSPPPRNGLCETCNRNQEIKVQQLASFEPSVADDFDSEVERFREKLEKSYELCHSCQRIVKKTISRVTMNVLGLKLAQIGAKGLQVLDRHVKGVAGSRQRITFNRICLAALILLSMWNLYDASGTVNLSKKHLDTYFPPLLTHAILLVVSYVSAVRLLVTELMSTIPLLTLNFEWMRFNVTRDINDFLNSSVTNECCNETGFLINSAAVLLSLKLVWENGVTRVGSMLIMLLWNVNMLWPKIAETMGNYVPGDFLKMSVAILLFLVTSLNMVLVREPATPKAQSKDNSFHRIYSDCDEDLSENSDGEATLYSDSYSSTPRSRKCDSMSILNNSFTSAKSFGPAVPMRPWMTSAASLNQSFRNEFQRTPCYQQSNQDLFNQRNNNDGPYYFPNKTISVTNRCSSMLGLNSSFRIPDDCQNKLTDLNISGISYRNHKAMACPSPTPSVISLSRHRSQLLTPSRLNFNGHATLTAPATQTSWVAGGYFVHKNNLSPQKLHQPTVPLHPILSRTSSHSSGFESQASSAHNGHANGSRESSIAGDVFSNFSEPTLFADSASQMGIDSANTNSMLHGGTALLPRPKPYFPLLNGNQSSAEFKPESLTNYSNFQWTSPAVNKNSMHLSPQPVYHQFGTHRQSFYNSDSSLLSHRSPSIRRGSLMKPFDDK